MSFRSLPVNRTPTTRAPAPYAASPYRSINVALPATAPTAPSSGVPSASSKSADVLVQALARATVSVPLKTSASASASASSKALDASPIPVLPCPLAYFPMTNNVFFHDGDDPKDLMQRIEAALREVAGGDVDIVQSQGECSMSCRVDAKDDARCCTVAVNLFDVSGEKDAPGNYLVEGARMSGCPVLFGHVTRHFMHNLGKDQATPSMIQHCAKIGMRRPFQAPALPESFAEDDKVADSEVSSQLEKLTGLALSQVAETRVMAIRALADALRDDKAAALFGRTGVARIANLLTDNDPMVRLAALRVSQRVEKVCGA